MTSLELLQGIELWLTVKKEPSKEEIDEYLIEIRKHIEEALAISRVVGRSEQLSCSTCKWLKRTDDYCDTCFKFKKHEPTT